MLAKSVSGIDQFLRQRVTPGFRYVEDGRAGGLKAMCDGIAMNLAGLKKLTRADADIVSIKGNANEAKVMICHTLAGIAGRGTDVHTITYAGTSADSYVKVAGAWQLARVEWIKQDVYYDGKLLKKISGKAR